MPDEAPHPTSPQPHAEHAMPGPTLWPAALALGSTLLLWGMISSLLVTVIGGALFASALAGWISNIRHERRKH